MKDYLLGIVDVLARQKADAHGLTSAEAADRLQKNGPNKLAEGKKETLLQKFLRELSDPMIIILIIAAAVSGITAAYEGESFTDVFIILAVVIINAVLGVAQESKAEKAIAALQEIAGSTSKVLRDGKQIVIRSEELVPGDVIVLEAGDAVPADARIIECASLKIEEAALTGESVPVNKIADALRMPPTEVYRQAIRDVPENNEIMPIKGEAFDKFKQIWEAQGLGWPCVKMGKSKIPGYVTVQAFYGSSTYDSRQFSILIENLTQDCTALGIEVKSPEEVASMLEAVK